MEHNAEREFCNAVAIATNDAIRLETCKATRNETNTQSAMRIIHIPFISEICTSISNVVAEETNKLNV